MFNLIGLQMTNQMPLNITGKYFKFSSQFLHTVLTENFVSGVVNRENILNRFGFAYCYNLYLFWYRSKEGFYMVF